MDFKTVFKYFKCDTPDKMYHIFQMAKPLLIDRLVECLLLNRNSPAGRPIKIDFDRPECFCRPKKTTEVVNLSASHPVGESFDISGTNPINLVVDSGGEMSK